MPEEGPPCGEQADLLGRISTAMVRAQKEFYGKGPPKAKSYLLDNFLLVAMSGGVLRAERTMVDEGREDLVRGFRQQFENEMSARFTGLVEEITGRRVINYQSPDHVRPRHGLRNLRLRSRSRRTLLQRRAALLARAGG
jgi:uncharacterized protein YbcI